MELIGGTIIKNLSIDLTLKCISAITTSASSIYGLIGRFNDDGTKPEDVDKVLKDSDLEAKIPLLESVLKNLRLGKHSPPLNLSLEGLGSCLKSIEKELKEISVRVTYNKSLDTSKIYKIFWFIPWHFRSRLFWKFDDIIENIKFYNKRLDERSELFFNILKTNDEFVSEESLIMIKNQKFLPNNEMSLMEKSLIEQSLMGKSKICAATSDYLLESSVIYERKNPAKIPKPTFPTKF